MLRETIHCSPPQGSVLYTPLPLSAFFLREKERLILKGDLLTCRCSWLTASGGNGKERQAWNVVSEHVTFESWLHSGGLARQRKRRQKKTGSGMPAIAFCLVGCLECAACSTTLFCFLNHFSYHSSVDL